MTGIEPALIGGLVTIATIVGISWKVITAVRSHVAEEIKPVQDDLKSAKSRIVEAEASLTDFRLEVARTYTTKEDVMNANKPVLDSVERLTHSVDRMGTRIDRVIEQSNAAKPVTRRRPAE